MEPTGILPIVIEIAYLLAAVLFIVGLARLSSPTTARGGNFLGAVGMALAMVATLLDTHIVSFTWIIVGVVIGSAIGAFLARWVKMTAMPQMVAVFNGFGGGASALVAAAEYLREGGSAAESFSVSLTIMLSVLIGAVTFSGSFIAWAKLEGHFERALTYPGQQVVNALIFLVGIAAGVFLILSGQHVDVFIVLAGVSLILGVLFVMPIGGADMPVVVALLNSYSGLAAAATGFVLGNAALIISGALVGASGIILSNIMCRAMNRSLANVLFGAFGSQAEAVGGGGTAAEGKIVRDINAEDAAIMMAYSDSVVFVPGYGMAVAQAQHQVRELAELLGERGVSVKFAIHPVAGRMPGHMNVLLAEANVPYDQLFEMDQINPEMERTDVAVVIGANDVVNPDAEENKSSPLYGMPIIKVHDAHNCIVMKRSLNPGFAGVDNPLFYKDKTRMLFGDAKKSLTALVNELKKID
ncbi:MAG: NAD(P)(+) transhydrogenase (Re/Si-specific) subunit beta [Gemmatimonadota bacterium]|jgi:NAD(P) transhydrogenase subunit beta